MQIILTDDRKEKKSEDSAFSSDGEEDEQDNLSSEDEMREFKIRQVNILPEVRRHMLFKSVYAHPDTNEYLEESSQVDGEDQGVLPNRFDPLTVRDRYQVLILKQNIDAFKKAERTSAGGNDQSQQDSPKEELDPIKEATDA